LHKQLKSKHHLKKPIIIAGPCSAESHEQVLRTASGIASFYPEAIFRAGVWKPRTRPGSFEGLGELALPWLKEVQQNLGLKVITEVANTHHAELCLKHDFEHVWIGARTVVNPFSVQEIADSLKNVPVTVLVKNPIHPDWELWMGAIERFMNAGVKEVIAVHRGFHGYGQKQFRNQPQWEIPIALKDRMPGIRLICDPSHIAGKPSLLQYIAQQSIDLGMDGFMIETHENPAQALSDARQQITPFELHELLNSLTFRESQPNSLQQSTLDKLRNNIDRIDAELIQLLAERMSISKEIGQYKKENNLTILQLKRWKKILRQQMDRGKQLQVNDDFVILLYNLIHQESIRIQSEVMNKRIKTLRLLR
jgi:chorismate mutase